MAIIRRGAARSNSRTGRTTALSDAQQGNDIGQGITSFGNHVLDGLCQFIFGLLLALLKGSDGIEAILLEIGDKVKAAPQGANYFGIAMSALDDMRIAQMETLFRRLPEKPVKPGDSYKTPKVRENHPAVGNLLVQADCSFGGTEPSAGGEAWKISCAVSKTPESAEAKSPGKLVEAQSTSEFSLAKDTGAIAKNSYRLVMAVEQTLPPQEGAAPDAPPATITQRDEITATLELRTGAPPAAAPPAEAPPAGS